MRLLPCGDAALLVEVDDPLALHAQLQAAALPGVVDLVPAARTVLLRLDPRATSVTAVAGALERLPPAVPLAHDSEELDVPVAYDGADLDEVAALTGLSREQVVEAHTGQVWTVAFGGFAPGFAYLVGQDERLHVPRRATPRTRVPAGAVALAGPYSGVYPRASPGGWQLIGTTTLPMWDLDREPAALLRPGVRVRFRAL